MSADRGTSQEQEQEQDTVDCRSCYGNSAVSVGKVHGARTGTVTALVMQLPFQWKFY